MKTALITFTKKLDINVLIDYKRKLSYDHFFIMTNHHVISEDELSTFKKFTIIICTRKEVPSIIDQLFDEHGEKYKMFPYFINDDNTKFSIKVYNKSFNLKIAPSVFRLKNKMNNYLGAEITKKKSIKYTYNEIQKTSYKILNNKIGKIFILKPINAVNSILNFRITSNEQFVKAKNKLTKKYDYIIEEYLGGSLYSIDFFCNGKDIFLLCFTREIPFLELLEKLSPEYMEKYKKTLHDEFLHFLPIRYTLDLSTMKQVELDFLNKIGKQLVKKKYHGLIHLEYKVERKKNKIGFIEWGARAGGYRPFFVDGMHNLRVENLPVEIIHNKDYSRFEKKDNLYFIKNRDIDRNFLMIFTSVLEKTHITQILKKTPDYLKISFEQFLKDYLWDNWKIRIKNIVFYLATSKEGYIYPFYERNDTKFNYIMEFEEESFKQFLKKKHKILEHLVFHDYKGNNEY